MSLLGCQATARRDTRSCGSVLKWTVLGLAAASVPTRRARGADRARGHRTGLPRDGCGTPRAVAHFRLRILSGAR